MNSRFLGLYTAIYHVSDLERAKAWFTRTLGITPYFDQPFYVGYNVGGHELGLVPTSGAPELGQCVAYWGVKAIHGTLDALLAEGARIAEEVTDVGGGIRVAAIVTPDGAAFGLIENPHFPNTATAP